MLHPLRRDDQRAGRPQGAGDAWDALTGTERTVAELVAQGLTNREVAARIFLSPHTVSFHLRKVYRKLRRPKPRGSDAGVHPPRTRSTIWRQRHRRRADVMGRPARFDVRGTATSSMPHRPLHGRETEVRRLGESVMAAAAGHGGVVIVDGTAGLGKSRLCWRRRPGHGTSESP